MLNYSNSTQTDCQLANSVKESLSASSLVQTSQDPTLEWISESKIAPTLTKKWLVSIEDPEEIATLLNWSYYRHTGGWFVRSVNPKTGQFANHGQFKPSLPLELDGKPQKYGCVANLEPHPVECRLAQYICSQISFSDDSKRPV